jgi:hypothetical protein
LTASWTVVPGASGTCEATSMVLLAMAMRTLPSARSSSTSALTTSPGCSTTDDPDCALAASTFGGMANCTVRAS